MRCLSVANSLKINGTLSPRFIMASGSDITPVERDGLELRRLSTAKLGLNEILADRPFADGLLLDSYDVQVEDLVSLKKAGFKVAMFADGNTMDQYPCDLVIDSAPAAESLPYCGLPETNFCLGSTYFPLREDFRKISRRESVDKDVRTIVVTFGGSDHDDITVQALKALSPIEGDFEILAILGPAYAGDAVKLANLDPRVRLLHNLSDIAPVMGSADIAVASSGGTASELAYLGVPMILLALSPDQIPVAEAMSKENTAVYLGPCKKVQTSDITAAIIKLMGDQVRRANMNKAGQMLIDGKGPGRIAEAVYSLFTEKATRPS